MTNFYFARLFAIQLFYFGIGGPYLTLLTPSHHLENSGLIKDLGVFIRGGPLNHFMKIFTLLVSKILFV